MADHIRKQIRDAAKTALTGLATTGANVFSGRVAPLQQSELPALLIFLNGDEGIHGASNGGATSAYSGLLRIEGVAAGANTLIDTLDQIAKEVELDLFADAPFLALLMHAPGPPSAQISIDEPLDGAEKRTGSVILTIPINYRTRFGQPDVKV
jgi:hypothetical protein